MVNKLISFLLIICVVVQVSCTKSSPVSSPNPPPPPTPSSAKSITSFLFNKVDNPFLLTDIIGVVGQDTITATFPFGTSLTNLIPTITFSGNSINPANRTTQNFTNPVTYTVGAEDGTTKNYFVIAKTLQSNSKDIISFTFQRANNPALLTDINGAIFTDSISLTVPFGTNITNLAPSITISGNSILPSNLSPQNFSSPIQYLVTAGDGTTKTYKVAVNFEPNSATLYITSCRSGPGPNIGSVYAIDPNTGSLKWRYAASSNSLTSSIAFSNGVLFSGIGNNITAIDTVTRNIKWQYTCGGFVQSTPTLVNGTLYINCNDHFLYAIDETTGNLKWRYQQDNYSGGGNWSSPTYVNGVIYVGSMDGYIYAIDAITGVLKWRTFNNYALGGFLHSSPSVVNGIVYIGDSFRSLLALNASDGSFRWVYQANSLFFSSPTVVNGVVFIGCSDGNLYAVDANTGTLRWMYPTGASLYLSPIVSDGIVFVGQDGGTNLYAIDILTGTLRWMYHNSDVLFSSPVVFNDVVYLGSINTVLAVNKNTGLLKWKFFTINSSENIISSPCIVDKQGNIYFSGISGSQN